MARETYTNAGVARLAGSRSPKLLARSEQMQREGIKIIGLGRGEPEIPTPSHIVEAAVAALRAGYTRYSEVEGIFPLREAVALKLERDNGVMANPETEILITNGGVEGIFLAMMALLEAGDQVLVFEPFFPHYEGWVTFPGAVARFVPCLMPDGKLRPTREALESRISPKTKLILFNSPHNPTGGVLDRDTLQMIVDVAMRYDLLIIADDVYESMAFTDDGHICIASLSPEAKRRTIVVNSLSKTYAMTGWRLGYVTAEASILKAMRNVHEKSCRMPSAFVQRAAIAALLGPQECVKEMANLYQRRRDWVVAKLQGLPGTTCPSPDGTFYVFPSIAGLNISSEEFAGRLLEERHVLVLPGAYYGPSGEGHLRISFATDSTSLEQGLAAIRETIVALAEDHRPAN